VVVDLLFEGGDGGEVVEGERFGDVLFEVVPAEVQGVEVEAFGGGEGHADLVAEEGVGDVVGGVVVDEDHDDAADYFADLVVDETLANDVED
jgi:hypothetical protein